MREADTTNSRRGREVGTIAGEVAATNIVRGLAADEVQYRGKRATEVARGLPADGVRGRGLSRSL